MKFAESDRKAFIARNACPPRKEDVWPMLDEGGDIIVRTRLKRQRLRRSVVQE